MEVDAMKKLSNADVRRNLREICAKLAHASVTWSVKMEGYVEVADASVRKAIPGATAVLVCIKKFLK